MESNKKLVPKFASFTAKRPASGAHNLTTGLRSGPSANTDIKHRKRGPRHGVNSHDEFHHTGRRQVREDVVTIARTRSSVDHEKVADSGPAIYVVDTKGDLQNVRYGGTSQWSIPKYVRKGMSHVLGMRSKLRLRIDTSGDEYFILYDEAFTNGFAHSAFRNRKFEHSRPRRLRKENHVSTLDDQDLDDFISLGSVQRGTQCLNEVLDQVRDIGVQQASKESGSDNELEITDLLEDHQTQGILEQNAEFNRAIRSSPDDISKWLQLIEHQEKMIQLDLDTTDSSLSRIIKTKLAETRLAMYDDALKLTSRSLHNRDLLWLGFLKEAKYVLDFRTQEQKWLQAMDDCDHSVKLRLERLNFMQSHYLRYGHETCKQDFIRLLIFLKSRYAHADTLHLHQDLCMMQTYVFLRLTVFLEQSGYHEFAFALWQSALDYICFGPPTSHGSLQSYAEFWDSEASRLGESTNGGWAKRLTSNASSAATQTILTPSDCGDTLITDTDFSFNQIVVREQQSAARFCLAGGIDDEGNDNTSDPYHIIMSSDICPVLDSLINSQDLHVPLMTAFLCFMRLPNLPSTSNEGLSWWRDAWVNGFLLDESASESYACSNCVDTFRSLAEHNVNASASLIEDASIGPIPESGRSKAVIRIMQMFSHHFPHIPDVDVLYLRTILVYRGVAAVAKEAKRLIKVKSQSVLLFLALYIIEQRRGNGQTAERIISTPIRMRASFSTETQRNLVLLWRTWIWHHFLQNEIPKTLQLLLALDMEEVLNHTVTDLKSRSTALLRSRRWIEEASQQSLHQNEMVIFVALIDIGMLLAYFEHERSLRHAIDYVHTKIALISDAHQERNKVVELLHESRTALIAHHARYVKPYRPLEIQSLLQESIKLFPHNRVFLEQYANQETSFGLNDRLRGSLAMFDHAELDSLPRWFTMVKLEHQRCVAIKSPQHSTRAILERAAESDSGEFCASLWLSFLAFEKSHGTIDQYRQVLSRALTKLPWVKNIVLDGLSYLDGKIPSEELVQLYDLLEERGIRMMHTIS